MLFISVSIFILDPGPSGPVPARDLSKSQPASFRQPALVFSLRADLSPGSLSGGDEQRGPDARATGGIPPIWRGKQPGTEAPAGPGVGRLPCSGDGEPQASSSSVSEGTHEEPMASVRADL